MASLPTFIFCKSWRSQKQTTQPSCPRLLTVILGSDAKWEWLTFNFTEPSVCIRSCFPYNWIYLNFQWPMKVGMNIVHIVMTIDRDLVRIYKGIPNIELLEWSRAVLNTRNGCHSSEGQSSRSRFPLGWVVPSRDVRERSVPGFCPSLCVSSHCLSA